MKFTKIAALLAAAGFSASAFATNGYFSHGYGIKAKSMGGVGIALPQDALAAATNPAGMAMVGDRVDFGLDVFMPDRTASWSAATFGVPVGDYRSGKRQFYVPEFGYNRSLGNDSTLGVVVYGNGGMNTAYNTPILAQGRTNTYSNLEQLFIAPTWAKKLNANHSIGVTLNLVRQTFEARGLQGFANSSSDSSHLTDVGVDTSYGWGLKFGWTGELTQALTLGATYQTETRMSKFDRYKGLFAEQGKFNIPETYGLGVAFKATPSTTIAADLVHISYGKIRSLANQSDLNPAAGTLGTANGAGFGWTNQNILKLGIAHQYSESLTLRAGYNFGKMPLTNKNTYFNILAPATVEQHLTLGGTWTFQNKSELTLSYVQAFNKGINGTGGDGASGAGNGQPGWPVNLKMKQSSLGIAYGWKL
ncbi:MAG: outer membrane protein transport protein [Sterolibacteriaceae bacterium MAG5]|nr:outer membrane protein transport protein [Candidatus Nitricoxidireducens bremensis]